MTTFFRVSKRNIVSLVALFALIFAHAVHAQAVQKDPAAQQASIEAKQQYVGAMSPDSTTTCSFTFTSGTGSKYLKYCVTANGNIVQFESPLGVEQIATAPIGEGYAFCDFDASKQYYDYAGYGDSGNWQAPVTLSSSATSVKISRKTTDGIYTLTQTITQNAGNALAQVTMALKNNTTTPRHVGVLRYADVDANGSTLNSFDYTRGTAFGYVTMRTGLQLQFISGATLNGGFSQDISGGPNPCNIFAHVRPAQNIDGSIFMQYDMQLGSNATGKVAVAYKSF
jgi:hypothetical protein